MTPQEKYALRHTYQQFREKLEAGSFSRIDLIVWMKLITDELAPEEKKQEEKGPQKPG